MVEVPSSSMDTTAASLALADADARTRDEVQGPVNEEKGDEMPNPDESRLSGSDEGGSEGSGEDFEVEKILGYRKVRGKPQWLIRWLGYGAEADSWEPRECLDGCEELLREFEEARGVERPRTQAARQAKSSARKGTAAAVAKAVETAPRGRKRKAPASMRGAPASKRGARVQEEKDAAVPFVGKGKPAAGDVFDDRGEPLSKPDASWMNFSKATADKEKKQPLPTKLVVLELFSGAGGLHMDGYIQSNKGKKLFLSVGTAVEIEGAPVATYCKNFPEVNVMHMGICRFLASARRLLALKATPAGKAYPGVAVREMRINCKAVRAPLPGVKHKGTLEKQNHDTVTQRQYNGAVPLRWLEFKISRVGQADQWVTDTDELAGNIAEYLASAKFGPHIFPLPGDVHVITGGPPCQGWSGYNTQRVTQDDLEKMLQHPENALLVHFMAAVWLYRPLYVVMEEVPAVAKPNVMDWMRSAFDEHSYNMTYEKKVLTGAYGCPQTRDRLILLAAREPAKLPRVPEPICEKYALDERAITEAITATDRCYPLPMERETYATPAHPAGPKLRSLVMGDSLTADLPIEAEEIDGRKKGSRLRAETHVVPYKGPPGTPYNAYLRQGFAGPVSNHVVQEMNGVDKARCASVPLEPDASWRHMAGFTSTMYAPRVMVLKREHWVGESVGARVMRSVPNYMRAHAVGSAKRKEEEEAFKAGKGALSLRHDWSLDPLRYPLVPYWCLTMKHGADEACYARLSYCAPHMTVHSYNQPHWHPSLHPAYPRVLSVREKARIQGFRDSHVFCGTVKEQYKQIANAVSPQLTIAIGRALLDALADAHGWAPSGTREYSPSLENFADFLAKYDAKKVADATRYAPLSDAALAPLLPVTADMSYTEMLVFYNTVERRDHSSRFCMKSPFTVLRQVEEKHPWYGPRIVALAYRKGDWQVAMHYRGFEEAEWSPLDEWRNSAFWSAFVKEVTPKRVDALMRARKGELAVANKPRCVDEFVYEPHVQAQRAFEELEKRYVAEQCSGWIPKELTKEEAAAIKQANAEGRGKAGKDDNGESKGGEGAASKEAAGAKKVAAQGAAAKARAAGLAPNPPAHTAKKGRR